MITKNISEPVGIRWGVLLCTLFAVMLWGCAPIEGEQPKKPERQRILVNFRLAEEAGKNTVRETAARILSRLESKVQKTSRTFELLPLISLEADAKTLLQLIRMPEVESIQPDREVKSFGSSIITAPITTPGATK